MWRRAGDAPATAPAAGSAAVNEHPRSGPRPAASWRGREPDLVVCADCGAERRKSAERPPCPRCGSRQVRPWSERARVPAVADRLADGQQRQGVGQAGPLRVSLGAPRRGSAQPLGKSAQPDPPPEWRQTLWRSPLVNGESDPRRAPCDLPFRHIPARRRRPLIVPELDRKRDVEVGAVDQDKQRPPRRPVLLSDDRHRRPTLRALRQ